MTKQPDRGDAAHALSGVRVLVGRARHQAGALSAELRKLGATVIEIPFIEIRQPRSFTPLDSALKNLSRYDWLILTSVNGVEALWQRMAALHLSKSSLKHLHVAAIGPATKKSIESRGGKVAIVPSELRKSGAHVDVVEAYETVVPQSSRTRLQRAFANPRRRPHMVTFTSSSTVRNFVELLGSRKKRSRQLDEILMASIGPVTSSTLREFGLKVDIAAKEFTIPGLIRAIRHAIV